MHSISMAAPRGRTATPTQVRECGCFGKNYQACVSLAILVWMHLHTSEYTSFIGAKSSFRFDRKMLTLTMLFTSVPADFRIFAMFSRAAF